MAADAVPVIWKTGKWNLQPRIVDESIIRHKPEEIGENEYENDRKSCVIYRRHIVRVRRSETAGQQGRPQSLLTCKVYSHVTAAALRCKDQVMRDVESVQEGCSDILADAKAINKDKTAEAEAAFIEDGVKV